MFDLTAFRSTTFAGLPSLEPDTGDHARVTGVTGRIKTPKKPGADLCPLSVTDVTAWKDARQKPKTDIGEIRLPVVPDVTAATTAPQKPGAEHIPENAGFVTAVTAVTG